MMQHLLCYDRLFFSLLSITYQKFTMILLLLFFVRLSTSNTIISKSLPKMEIQTVFYPLEIYSDSNTHSFSYTFQESQNGQITISPIEPLKSIDNACKFIAWTAQMELISSHPSAWQNTYGPLFYNEVYVPSKRLLYSLSLDLRITVYQYAPNGTLHKETSMELEGENKRYTQIRPHLILSDDEEYLYVVVPMNYNLIWRINTNDLLGRIQSQIIEEFDLSKPILKAISHNKHIYLVLDTEGLIVFKILEQGILELVDMILQVEQKSIFPVSLALNPMDNLLFVLDSIQNIYVFNVTHSIKLHDKILFSHPQNIQIQLYHNRIYCSFYDKQFAIMELVYDPRTKSATLIRFFTSDQYITNFQILDDLLLVLSSRNLEIFPANLDPRLVKKQLNSIHQVVKGDKIVALEKDQYLFIGKNTFTIYKLHVKQPKLECRSTTESLNLNITYNGISKRCYINYTSDIPFYHACNFTQTVQLELPALEPTNGLQFFFLYIILILTLVLVFAIYKLIAWLKEYLNSINTLNNQISQLQRETSVKESGEIFEIQVNDDTKVEDGKQYTQHQFMQRSREMKVFESQKSTFIQ